MKQWLLAAVSIILTTILSAQNISSTFDTNVEGWTAINRIPFLGNSTYTLTHLPSGGNPNGCISVNEATTSLGVLFFVAPPIFRGNKTLAYGNKFSFDIRSQRNPATNTFVDEDIIIEGANGVSLFFYLYVDNTANPITNWTHFDIPMIENSWFLEPRSSPPIPCTKAQFQSVLCNITRIWIRGEYANGGTGADIGFLDNVTLEMTPRCYKTNNQNITICTGQPPVVFNGKSYSTTGIYTDTIKNPCSLLCDSIIKLNLKVVAALTRTLDTTICSGQFIKVAGNTYIKTGVYTNTVKSVSGCDSIITANLTVLPPLSISQNLTICQGNFVTVGSKNYNQSGSYTDVFRSASGCDSTVITNLTVLAPIRVAQSLTICQGSSIKLGNNTYNRAGIYKDTVQYTWGCDSLITSTTLTVNPTSVTTQNLTICQGGFIRVGIKTYNQSGVFRDTLKSSSNCDSIVITTLLVNPISIKRQSFTICQGGFIKVGTITYNQSGVFNDTLKNFTNCDSIVTTTLIVNPISIKTQNLSICAGDYINVGSKTHNRTGVYTDTLKNFTNCDSIITTNLTVNPISVKNQNLTICQGDFIRVGTKTYNQSGVYKDTLINFTHCDSLVTTTLLVNPISVKSQSFTICQGGFIKVGTKTYNQSGIFTDTLKNFTNCDSIITSTLTVNPISVKNQSFSICQGSFITVGSKTYNRTGVFVDTLKNFTNCDSIITTTLTVNPVSVKSQNLIICQGDFITVGSKTYNQSGVYKDTLRNFTNCDSLVTTTLTVNVPSLKSQNLTICQGSFITVGRKTYNRAGVFIDMLKNSNNCDSIITTTLTVSPPLSISQNLSICEGNFIKIGNKIYNQSGIFRDTLRTASGCDSLVTTNLTVNKNTSRTQNVSICPTSSYTVNNKTYKQAGTFYDTLRSQTGCDSVVITVLSIKNEALFTQNVALCEGSTLKVGAKTYSSTGIYRDTFRTVSGCDSIVVSNLTINKPSFSTLKATICKGESFSVGTKNYTQSGTFTEVLKNAANCDSSITTILTVLPPLSISQNLTICQGNFIKIGNKTYNKTGVFVDTLKSFSNCDSIVTTNLTVSPPLSISQNFSVCEGNFIKIGNKTYNQTGVFKDTLSTASGCDSIVTTTLTVNKKSSRTQNISICPTSSYNINYHTYKQAGTYYDTLYSKQGCDSVVITVLSVQNAIMSTQNMAFCEGNSLKVGARMYTSSGNYIDTIRTVSGCDSIVFTNLTVNKPSFNTLKATICQGESFIVGTKMYTQSGTFTEILKNAVNCDSIITTQLKVIPPLSISQNLSVCEGESIKIGAKTYNKTGVFKDTLKTITGCDSIITTNLTVNKRIVQTQNVGICPTGSLTVGSHTYTKAGTYFDTLRTVQGCDSIVSTILTLQTAARRSQNKEICNGQSFKVGNHVYTQTGIYQDTFRAIVGCDSIVTTNLVVSSVFVNSQSLNICEGDFIKIGAKTYNKSGIFTDTLKSLSGCDSIILTLLKVNPRTIRTQTLSICPSTSLKIGSHSYNRTGTYQDTLKSIFGCDSLVTTILTVQPVAAITQTIALCSGQSIKIGAHTYTQSGIYRDTLKTLTGCDSLVTTDLSINTVILKTQNMTICEGESMKIGTRTYTKSGIFKDTLRAIAGCDSIITTNLTVARLSILRIDTTICANKKLVFNGKTYTQAGVFSETIKGVGRCDSVIQISLTLQPLSLKRNDITLCPNDTIIINGKALRQAGVYRDTIASASGCPQIVESYVQNSSLRISAGTDITIELGDSARLSPAIPTGTNILWKWLANKALSCTDCANPIAKPLESTIFSVEAKDTASDCTVRDDIRVVVKSCSSIFLPTSFSPNNDGKNDYFTVFASGCVQKVKKMLVFNRWGALVFSKENFSPNDEQAGWDGTFQGKSLVSDVYTYVFELEVKNGKTEKVWGDVTLMK